MLKRILLCCVFAGALLISLFKPLKIEAGINSKDLHSFDGKPVLSTEPLLIYKDRACTKSYNEKIKPNKVFRIQSIRDGKATLYYKDGVAYVKSSKLLADEELDNFVAKNVSMFSKKITLIKDSDIFALNTENIVANAKKRTSFLITGEDDRYYFVSFDGNSGRVLKENVTEEIYVKVIKYGDKIETIASLIQNARKIINESGITTSVIKEVHNEIVSFAIQFEGNPYVWGGTSLTDGTDCSGFTQSIYKHFGIEIPRTSCAQSTIGKEVSLEELQPGDLLFYNRGSRIGHVVMFIGNGKIIHAKSSLTGIVVEDLNRRTPIICKRILYEEKLNELKGN